MGEYGVDVITREMRKIAILVGIINSAIRADVRIVKVKAMAFDSQPAICKSESIRLSLVNYSRARMWSIGVLRGGGGWTVSKSEGGSIIAIIILPGPFVVFWWLLERLRFLLLLFSETLACRR